MNILIKKATTHDADQIKKLESKIFNQTYFTDYQNTFMNNQSVLIALGNNNFVGIIGWFEQVDSAEIIMVGVDEPYRLQGIGTMLIKACISLLLNKQVKTLYLEVSSNNQRAINLYKSFGFTLNRTRTQYYKDTKEDALEMRLDL